MKHTPGPWVYRPETDSRLKGYIRAKSNGIGGKIAVCRVNYTGNSMEEVEANARLIASAPDMLRALERIAFEPQGPADATDRHVLDACVEIAKEAIGRATGDTWNHLYDQPPGVP